VWAGASAATSILGPFVGGVLVNSISWRAAFFVNVPFLLVALWAMRHVPESRDEEATGHFDWLGSAVVALAVGGLAFGTIRGQQSLWTDVGAFVALGVGAVAAIAFPIMMLKRRNPLVPPSLFQSRNFTVTNISTFVIYGALYVSLSFQGLFLIGTLGYNEPAAGIAGLPAVLFLTLFSTRFGKLAARYGPRLFMAVGPFIMGLGLLYLVRFPADSTAWIAGWSEGETILPPGDYFVDLLPSLIIFGIGLMIMVAPLTTALMTSVPKHNSGVASAINNAISRVGAPLVGALLFVAVASSFYTAISDRVPDVDTAAPSFRQEVSPLNVPEDADPEVIRAARVASTDAFHLSALVAAGLLWVGAAVNAVGIRNPKREEPSAPEVAPPGGAPQRVDTIPEDVPCLPVTSPTALPRDARLGTHEPG
jgi:MFS family permease